MKTKMNLLFGLPIFLLILSACGNNSGATLSPTPYFPQLKEEPNGYATALLMGELMLVDGCLRLDGNDGNSYLLIWPYDYSIGEENGVIQIFDGAAQAVAQVGDILKTGGGESSLEHAQSLVASFPESCPGPYWLVGQGVEKIDEK
ncbi:MAG: hypothetical protein Fur0022_43650 [Anaerolineales bacterium]